MHPSCLIELSESSIDEWIACFCFDYLRLEIFALLTRIPWDLPSLLLPLQIIDLRSGVSDMIPELSPDELILESRILDRLMPELTSRENPESKIW